jgi:polysaccharide deacetylase 2 family uncharacterized protein YibQ
VAVTKKKPPNRSRNAASRASKRVPPNGAITLSIAAVAIALAILLGGLFLHGSAVAKKMDEEPTHVPAEGASGAVAENSEPAEQAKPEAQFQPEPRATVEPSGGAVEPQHDHDLPQLPKITGFRAAKELNNSQNDRETNAISFRLIPSPKSSPQTGTQVLKAKRTLIFIIDDAGYNMKQLKTILDLPFPLTVAVLPGLPHSGDAAKAVRTAGKELILHQPMQAVGGQNPGPGAIRLGMSDDEVEATIEANLATVPGAVGMNNHMGSAATADLGLMEAAAAIAKKRGIYYLDSRTTSQSTIPVAARREGIRYWERDVFLDNTPDRASITRAVEDGKKRSEKDRPAIMIGHVWSSELAQALTDLYPQLIAEGFSLSTISRYMVQEATEGDDE